MPANSHSWAANGRSCLTPVRACSHAPAAVLCPLCAAHAGIADLLRVLGQRASEVLKAPGEDDEGDDEMEVDATAGGSSASEDDSSDDELDEGQQEQLKVAMW
jgi:hypothetical protein